MKKFSEFQITPMVQTAKGFIGDRIEVDGILNRPITVHDYRIEDSKYKDKGNGKCLHLQIQLGETKHVVFTGSQGLMQMIQQVPKEDFPFMTTIVKESKRFLFT